MELVDVEAIEEAGYDRDSLIGVDLVTSSPDEKDFCQSFPEALNAEKPKARIRIAEDYRLVLEYIGEGQETRTFKMSEKQAERIGKCLSDPRYKRRVCFLNGGYDALAIRFIRMGSTKQTPLIEQERN